MTQHHHQTSPSTSEVQIGLEVPIARIRIDADRRPPDEPTIAELAKSVELNGQFQPILVRPVSNDPEHDWQLVAGLQRLRAQARRGQKVILARILQLNDEQSRLVEIDENLIRKALSPAEEALALLLRKRTHDAHRDDRAKAAHVANQRMGRGYDAGVILTPAFSEQTAKLTGCSKRTVERAIARAAEIGARQLRTVAHTSLDKEPELTALPKLSAADRKFLIERAAAGEKVSAVRLLRARNPTEPAADERSPLERLQFAWDMTPIDQQDLFLEHNSLMRRSA